MENVYEAYCNYFNTGDKNKLVEDLTAVNCATPKFKETKIAETYRDSVRLLAGFFSVYGFDAQLKDNKIFGRSNIYNVLEAEKNEPTRCKRLGLTENEIDSITIQVIKNLPEMKFKCSSCKFDGILHFTVGKNGIGLKTTFVKDAIKMYLTGAVLDGSLANKLLKPYIQSHNIMQAVFLENVGTEWLNEILVELDRWDLTVFDFCKGFDNIWFDTDNQLSEGFISLYNPSVGLSQILCISTNFTGEYFATNFDVFKILYERDILKTIRFARRVVKTYRMQERDIIDMELNVPVFTQNDRECLVSDLIPDFVYNNIAQREIIKTGV